MRAALDRAYAAGLWLACLCLVAIAVLVLVQVAGRLIDRLAMAMGAAPLQIAVPSLAEIGGFLLVAASCLALAGTLQQGGHVRVTMITGALPAAAGRIVTLLAIATAAGLAIWASWHSGLQALDSWQFNSLSFGIVKIPLWLPQGAMTSGLGLLAVALVDAFVTLLSGGVPGFLAAEQQSDLGAE
ncbi:TRAP transporter small permease [Paracoccus sp. M683]|uniref:TRAP transporter small permease n=1 Tax=Paracoccus sp. M683 TaxID=2594268 RepID=UPI00117C8207|nr:TRAP transporter small permease [Paracoccus sp. M683]TRW98228.1 TRAP transporter small permease [Paracoccus sp. M683]